MSLLKSVPVGWSIEEEFFSGYLRLPTLRMLESDFPWIGEWRRTADSGQDAHTKASIASAYRQRMNDHAAEVTDRLLSLRHGPIVMKVFPEHLAWPALDDIVERWRPKVVILRRRLLFSYLSTLKAEETGTWFNEDNTSATFSLESTQASQYMAQADGWFDHVLGLCERVDVPWFDAHFEGVIESDHQREALFEFLGVDHRWRSATPTTTRQDRRTDASLMSTLQALRSLAPEQQEALMRLPGPRIV